MVVDIYNKDSAKKKTAAGAAQAEATPSGSVSSSDASYVPGGDNKASNISGLEFARNSSKIKTFSDFAAQYGAKRKNTQSVADVALQRSNNPDNIDIAERLGYAMRQPVTYNSQQYVSDLLRNRNLKIAQNPEKYGQYQNDTFQKEAEAYLSQIAMPESNTQKYINNMADNANDYYQLYAQNLAAQRDAQSEALRQQYEQVRRAAIINSAKNSLGVEEALAAKGLGRGASNAVSSGMGETSRISAQVALNNNLSNAYLAEQQALQELQNQYNNNFTQFTSDYLDRMSDIDAQTISQANADKQLAVNIAGMNADNAYRNKSFDYQRERDEIGDTQWRESMDYQKARDNTADAQWQKSFDYQSERDKVGDAQWREQFDWQKNTDERDFNEGVRQFDQNLALSYYNIGSKGGGSGSRSGSSGGGGKSSSSGTNSYTFDNVTSETEPENLSEHTVINNIDDNVYNMLQNGSSKNDVLNYLRLWQDQRGLGADVVDAMIEKYNLLG